MLFFWVPCTFRKWSIMVLHKFLPNLICCIVYFEELLKSSFFDTHPQILFFWKGFVVKRRTFKSSLRHHWLWVLNTSRQIYVWIPGMRSSFHYLHWLLAWWKLWFWEFGDSVSEFNPWAGQYRIKIGRNRVNNSWAVLKITSRVVSPGFFQLYQYNLPL